MYCTIWYCTHSEHASPFLCNISYPCGTLVSLSSPQLRLFCMRPSSWSCVIRSDSFVESNSFFRFLISFSICKKILKILIKAYLKCSRNASIQTEVHIFQRLWRIYVLLSCLYIPRAFLYCHHFHPRAIQMQVRWSQKTYVAFLQRPRH